LEKSKLSLFLSISVITIFFYFLIKYSVLQHVEALLLNLNPYLVAISLALYSLTYLFRALRFKLFFREVKTFDMFSVMCVHTFFNNIFPFRSGESSFPIILKKLFSIPLTSSSTALLIARIFDLITLSILFLLSSLLVNVLNGWLLIIPATLLLTLAVLLFLSYKTLYLLRKRNNTFERLFLFVHSFLNRKNMALTFTYSFLTWSLKFASFFFILISADFKISPIETVFASTFGEATTILPIHSIGGFGTYEAGLVGGFKIIGINVKTALPIALYFHSALLLMSAILALFGWIKLSRNRP